MARVTLLFAVGLIALGVIGYLGGGAAAASNDPGASAPDAGAPDAGSPDADAAGRDQPKRSVTALIPAFTGGLLLLFGLLALNDSWRKHAMHGAVLIGLLGFLAAGGRGAMGLVKLMSDSGEVNTRSLMFVCAMAVICAVYVVLCVNSFIQARKRQRAEQAAE